MVKNKIKMQKQKKYKFDELSPGMKKSLLTLMTTRYTFEGRENPEEEATIKLTKLVKERQKKNQWSLYRVKLMKIIDEHRVKLGLEKIHNIVGI